GWLAPEEVCARAMELDDREFLSQVFAQHKIEGGDVEGWVRRKQVLTRAMLADSPRLYPGVTALVERLRGTVTLAVVSTTWRENITSVLGSAGLLPAFALIGGKEDVGAQKPAPEGYRLAVQRLGVAPADAVALEDSSTGLAAARGAGLRVVAIGHRLPHGPWAGDAAFLPDLRKTDQVLDTLCIPTAR